MNEIAVLGSTLNLEPRTSNPAEWSDAELAALHSSAFHLGAFLGMVRESCKQWGAPGWVTPEPAVDPGP